ncbi:expressed protein [Phakopsora pachyrhizi]|uniref:Expressed protein n=1 Tax=Phakopsora pachyrhizi TaxID=170000 RepID=A0AAV0AZA1_PHAPC|nr:expressed protein [Phakopsora pachyrhizi]
MVTSGGSGLEIKAFGLGASFFKPKDNLVDPEAEGLTEAVEADKRSETSSFSKSESMDTDCVNSRQLTEEDWPPTPTSLSRFPGDGPSKNGEFRATPLNSISPRDASSVDYCESGRAYIESDHEIRIKPLSEASAITPTIAEFHEAAKRDNCAQASSVSEKFYSGEETPRSNTICADEFEESLTRGTRMVFSQQTNVESYPTGYLNSLGIQLSGPTIQTDHDIRQVSLAEASAISPTIASFHADLKVWPEASNLEAERKMPPATGHSIEKLFVAEDSAPTPKLTNQMRTLKEMDSIDPAVEPISPPRQPSPDLSQRLESAEAGGDASSQFPGYEKMDSISSNSEVSPIRVDTTIQTVSLASASEISPSIAKFHNKMEDTNLVNPAKNLDEIEVLNVVASQLSLEDKQSNDAVVASHQEAEASDYSGSTSSLESFTSDRLMENLVAEDSALTPTLTNQMRTLKEMDSIDPAVEPISPPRQPSPDLSQRLESAEAGGDASIQFPGYEKMDPMSPNFEVPPIRVDTTIQTVSLANASEISPSIAKFHNKMEDTNLVNPAKNLDEIEVLNVVASQLSLEDKQSNDAVVASHQEIEISDSSDSISSLESSAVAISTDDPEASPHPRRHPILSEDSKFDGISKRLSLLRLSSPGIPIISPSGDLNSSNIPIEIPLQVNMNGSHSESSASDDFEVSSAFIFFY